MNAKLLLVIVGALVVLFFVGTSWGLLSDDQSVGGAAKTVVNMVRGLQEKEPLTSSDVSRAVPPTCREQLRRGQFKVSESESCQLNVGDASTPVRTLTLGLQQGNQVRLRLIAGGENRMDQTETLPTDSNDDPRRIELQFVREGGQLVITCTNVASPQNVCVINVL